MTAVPECGADANGRMIRTAAWPALLLLACWGCTKTPVGTAEPLLVPQRHGTPAWARGGALAYQDNGIVCITSSGSYIIDTTKVGLWIAPAGGMQRYRFLSYRGEPAWSPSGDTLAVALNHSIQLYRATTGLLLQTMVTGEMPFYLSWSPNGEYIFWCQAYDCPGVYCAHVDSLVPRRLVADGGYPEWDPAAEALIYLVGDETGRNTVLKEIDPKTGLVETLLVAEGILLDERMAPDGQTIVFSAPGISAARWELHAMSRDGRNRKQLTTNGGAQPAWSLRGDTLAYVQVDAGSASVRTNTIWRLVLNPVAATELVPAWPEACPP